jgi:predicted HicB family RNase H-like nuclease
MNTMTHKGYTARVEFDERDAVFAGRILGISDAIGFHGETVAELRAAFEEAVDDYLATCQKIGKQPLKPVSGNMMLRVPPEVHLGALIAAESHGKSLNQWATDVLRKAASPVHV